MGGRRGKRAIRAVREVEGAEEFKLGKKYTYESPKSVVEALRMNESI